MSSDIIGPKIPFPIFDPKKLLGIIGRVIDAGKSFFRVLFDGNENVQNSKPLDEKNNTANEMMQLNSILIEYRDKVSKESKNLEQEIQNVCKIVFEQVIESVEFANSEFKFYRIETLQRKLNSYLSEIDGAFEKHVRNRITLDDPECIGILKMLPGDLKGQRMMELKRKVFDEAIDDLCDKLKEFQMDISESMEMTVEEKLNSVEINLQERTEAFQKMSSETENTQNEKEKVYIKSEWEFSVAQLFDIIQEGEL